MNLFEPHIGNESTDVQESQVVLDQLGEWRKTTDCNRLRAEHVGREDVLMGWVQRRRDHGGLIFVDLRDREGITQVVFDPQISHASHERAGALRSEYVIAAKGKDALSSRGDGKPKAAYGRNRSRGNGIADSQHLQDTPFSSRRRRGCEREHTPEIQIYRLTPSKNSLAIFF